MMVSLHLYITLFSLVSLLPLSARSLTIQTIPPLPQIIPGAQVIVTWQRKTTSGFEQGSKDPSDWHFQFMQNGAQIDSTISVPGHAAPSGTMTLTIPSDAIVGAPLQLLAVNDKKTSAFTTFFPFLVQPTFPPIIPQPIQSLSTPSKDSATDSTSETASSTIATISSSEPQDSNAISTASPSATSPSLTTSRSSLSPVVTGEGNASTSSKTGRTSLFTTTSDPTNITTKTVSYDPSTNTGIDGDAAPTATMPTATTTAAVGNHPSNRAAIIAGSVVGALVLLLVLTSLYCFWRRRSAKREQQANNYHTSFDRDMMIRSNSGTPTPHTGLTSASPPNEHTLKLKDSQRFKFEPLSGSVGGEIGVILGNGVQTKTTANEKDKVVVDSHRVSSSVSSTRSSTSNPDETTPSLAMGRYSYSSAYDHILAMTQEEIKSPATTSVYSALTTLSSETFCSTYSGYNLTRIPIPAFTDRQMDIQAQIMDLQQRMIGKSRNSSARELHDLREEIQHLEELNKTDWALELTDLPPNSLKLGSGLGQRRSSVGVAI